MLYKLTLPFTFLHNISRLLLYYYKGISVIIDAVIFMSIYAFTIYTNLSTSMIFRFFMLIPASITSLLICTVIDLALFVILFSVYAGTKIFAIINSEEYRKLYRDSLLVPSSKI